MQKAVLRKMIVMSSIGLTLTGAITALLSWYRLAPGADFLSAWLPAWAFGFAVMFPISSFWFLAVQKLVRWVSPTLSGVWQQVITGIIGALGIEAVMSAVVTFQQMKTHDNFGEFWASTYLVGIPIALVIGSVMSTLVMPRVQAYLAR